MPASSSGKEAEVPMEESIGSMIERSQCLLERFLEYVDPTLLNRTPSSQVDIPITQWDTLYSSQSSTSSTTTSISPSIIVRSHPSPSKNLFSVQSVVPGINARQFWSLMADSSNRSLWDSTIEMSQIEWWLGDLARKETGIEEEDREVLQAAAHRLSARVEMMRFGSIMFVASKRDMVLLSIDSQLPSTDGRLRLLSTSTSIQDARIPLKKGYARFHLEIGGFLVEDLGNPDGARGSSNAGVRVTQLSDLGEMASWVPSSIIRMVASTMVPRSINTITKVAAKMKVPSALTQQGNGYAGQGEDGRELERLSDVGGTWHPGRHLPPIWSRSEVAPRKLSFNNSTEADSSSSTLVVPSEKEESAIESGQDHDAISSETKPLQMPPTSPLDHIGEGDPVNARLSTESIASPSTNLNSRVNIRAVSGRTDSAASFNSGVTLVDEDTVAATAEEGQPNRSEGRDRLNDDDEEVASAEESSAAQYSHILSGHAKTFSRRSPAQKTAQRRLSTMLMNGSEAIAIMIAPAARDSMISVAHIMEASINGNLSNALILEEDALEDGYVNILSNSAPRPLMTLPRGAGATIKASMISVNAYPSSSSQISISNGNNRHQLDPSSSSTASWTTAIAVAPYTLAISILNFAVWSTSAAVEKGGEDVGSDAEDVRSTALSQTRKAYLQRDMFKEKVEERPRSYYRTDDTKLYPFPLLISDTLPPLGIAASSGVLMDCEPARLPAHDVTPKQASWWGSYW